MFKRLIFKRVELKTSRRTYTFYILTLQRVQRGTKRMF